MKAQARTPSLPLGTLPNIGYLRQAQIVPHLIPVSAATWWRWVRSGKAPKPVKLSHGITAWNVADIRDFIATITDKAA